MESFLSVLEHSSLLHMLPRIPFHPPTIFSAKNYFPPPSSVFRNLSFPEHWKIQNFVYMVILALGVADCAKVERWYQSQTTWTLSQELGI